MLRRRGWRSLTRATDARLSYREVVDLARDRASREYLIGLMRELDGNVTEAARRAGMERESLHRLLKRYGIRSESSRSVRHEHEVPDWIARCLVPVRHRLRR